jgi:hypothetical protein
MVAKSVTSGYQRTIVNTVISIKAATARGRKIPEPPFFDGTICRFSGPGNRLGFLSEDIADTRLVEIADNKSAI